MIIITYYPYLTHCNLLIIIHTGYSNLLVVMFIIMIHHDPSGLSEWVPSCRVFSKASSLWVPQRRRIQKHSFEHCRNSFRPAGENPGKPFFVHLNSWESFFHSWYLFFRWSEDGKSCHSWSGFRLVTIKKKILSISLRMLGLFNSSVAVIAIVSLGEAPVSR